MTLVSRQSMVDDSGLFTDGTSVDKAFVDQIYGQVDDQAHSTTNPAIKPKAITDEVVAARGSKASLDARLDISLEEDGTLKSQVGLVTTDQIQSGLGGRNVAINGDLDLWTAGGAVAPSSFVLTGAAATIARTGIAMADTFHFGTGSGFAAKVTRAGTDWKLAQDVISAANFAKFTNVKSQKVSVAVKGKTGIASHLRLVIDDGVTTTASAFHTGGGTEEHLSVTHTISASATKLSFYVEGLSSNGDAYVGGFNAVFSGLAPSDWSPLSQSQQMVKQAASFIANVGNVGAGEDTLASYTIPAGTMSADGMAYEGEFFLQTVNNANAKSLILRVIEGANNNVLLTFALTASELGIAHLRFLIIRTAAATFGYSVFCTVGPINGPTSRAGTNNNAGLTLTWANAVELRLTGTATADNDILLVGGIIKQIPLGS